MTSRIYCAVFDCMNSSLTNPEITFFRLPGNSERRLQWLQLICRDDLEKKPNFTSYRVCEKHFNLEDVLQSSNRKRLKKNVLPSSMLPSLARTDPGVSRKEDKQTQTAPFVGNDNFTQTENATNEIFAQTPTSLSSNITRKRNSKAELLQFTNSAMDDEQLIGLVRAQPVLYDPEHKKYMDAGLKNGVWRAIGRAVGLKGVVCKTRWNNIRDNYRRSIKKNAQRVSAGKKPIKPYKFHQELRFLKPFISERCMPPDFKRGSGSDGATPPPFRPSPPHLAGFEDVQPAQEYLPLLRRHLAASPTPASPQQDLSNLSGDRSSEILEYLARRSDPVDAFLASFAPTLRELHPCDWVDAKADLFRVVQKYERKLMSEKFATRDPTADPEELKTEAVLVTENSVEDER